MASSQYSVPLALLFPGSSLFYMFSFWTSCFVFLIFLQAVDFKSISQYVIEALL